MQKEGYRIPEDVLSAFYKNKSNSTSISKDIPEEKLKIEGCIKYIIAFIKKHWAIITLVGMLLLVAVLNILVVYYPNKSLLGISNFITYFNTLAWLVFLLKPVADKFLEKISGKIFDSTKQYTEIRTQVEEEERLNSPEQFEAVFNNLISCLKKGKLVIVFDNIDRVQGDIALKTLSTIKTFLDPIEKTRITFLVPCDADAINKQIRAFYKNEIGEDFDESEYLKKLFNTVIFTPEFIDDDIYQYATALIDATGDIKNLFLNDNVLSVITKAFKNNPREIKQFINNLIAAVLVASKTTVADLILAKENIGFFTKVIILKQKFPLAYKRLRENWNDPQKIMTNEPEPGLRDFLTLTSTITTDDAEPYIYFKAPQIEHDLSNSKAIRKALVDGNTEEFEKLASLETKKNKLIRFISLLLKNYKSQSQVLLRIFKSQLQGLDNLKEKSNNADFLERCLDTIEAVWNSYLELSPILVFELLVRSNNTSRREAIIDRYVLTLSDEQVKAEQNKLYLHNLIDELIKNRNHLTVTHQTKVMDAIRQNLENRDEILLQFDKLEIQKIFVHPDSIRKIIQEDLNNKNLERYLPILILYKDYIESFNLAVPLLARIPQFISLQNSLMSTSNMPDKLLFQSNLLTLFSTFGALIKDLSQPQQQEILNGLNMAYGQVPLGGDASCKIVNGLRWLSLRTTDTNVKTQSDTKINSFISQSSGEMLGKVLSYWNEKAKLAFIKTYFASIKARIVNENTVFTSVYESGDDSQRLELIQHAINHRTDSGLKFLSDLGEQIPDRQEVIKTLLTKAQNLSIQDREGIFQYLKGKIKVNDDVILKQLAIKQILECLKSNNQHNVDFGVILLEETFLSDSDHREIAKEMLDFYNNRSGSLQKYDLGVINHLARIKLKLQGTLKEKFVYLIFSNVSPDRQFEIIPPLLENIAIMEPDSDEYEKDYSDLIERLTTWPDVNQKNQIVQKVIEIINKISGTKAKEYLQKIETPHTDVN